MRYNLQKKKKYFRSLFKTENRPEFHTFYLMYLIQKKKQVKDVCLKLKTVNI